MQKNEKNSKSNSSKSFEGKGTQTKKTNEQFDIERLKKENRELNKTKENLKNLADERSIKIDSLENKLSETIKQNNYFKEYISTLENEKNNIEKENIFLNNKLIKSEKERELLIIGNEELANQKNNNIENKLIQDELFKKLKRKDSEVSDLQDRIKNITVEGSKKKAFFGLVGLAGSGYSMIHAHDEKTYIIVMGSILIPYVIGKLLLHQIQKAKKDGDDKARQRKEHYLGFCFAIISVINAGYGIYQYHDQKEIIFWIILAGSILGGMISSEIHEDQKIKTFICLSLILMGGLSYETVTSIQQHGLKDPNPLSTSSSSMRWLIALSLFVIISVIAVVSRYYLHKKQNKVKNAIASKIENIFHFLLMPILITVFASYQISQHASNTGMVFGLIIIILDVILISAQNYYSQISLKNDALNHGNNNALSDYNEEVQSVEEEENKDNNLLTVIDKH